MYLPMVDLTSEYLLGWNGLICPWNEDSSPKEVSGLTTYDWAGTDGWSATAHLLGRLDE